MTALRGCRACGGIVDKTSDRDARVFDLVAYCGACWRVKYADLMRFGEPSDAPVDSEDKAQAAERFTALMDRKRDERRGF